MPDPIISETFAVNDARPKPPTEDFIRREKARCAADIFYFIDTYCKLLDTVAKEWVPFKIWPAQKQALLSTMEHKYTIGLKARQLGITWVLAVAKPIWKMLFKPIAIAIVVSKGEVEAKEVIERIKGMYDRLPDWMRLETLVNNTEELKLSNESRVFMRTATSGGRSSAATDFIIDECDYVENLQALMAAAKPTIDAGDNQMLLISTANADTPESLFKKMCISASEGRIDWNFIFLPWNAHPARTDAWYEKQKAEALYTQGNLDSVNKEYPATLQEALASPSTNNRISSVTIAKLFNFRPYLDLGPAERPLYPTLHYFSFPVPGRSYVLGIDTAEGLPGPEHDDSVIHVLDKLTLEQCAIVAGRITPSLLAQMAAPLADYFNGARILVEYNNHGATCLKELERLKAQYRFSLEKDIKGRRDGWMTSAQSKIALYDNVANILESILKTAFEDGQPPDPIIFETTTSVQLGRINVESLAAPEGQHDDYAMAYALALWCARPKMPGMQQLGYTGLYAGEVPKKLPVKAKTANETQLDWVTQMRFRNDKTRRP